MTRNQTTIAGYIMLGTAFVLTALVIFQSQRFVDNQAKALMVIDKGSFTIMTAPINGSEELLYVLDSRSGMLLAYAQDRNARDKRIALLDRMVVATEMDAVMKLGGGGGKQPGRFGR